MSESSAIAAALGAGLGALAGMVFGGWLTLRSARRAAERVMDGSHLSRDVAALLVRADSLGRENQVLWKCIKDNGHRIDRLEQRSHLAQPRTPGGRFAKKGGE